MGRKDLTEKRTSEILDAFARSMIKYGLDTSLEQVSEEAGMTRSIIRHYIGNREDVINTLIERITQEYIAELQEEAAQIPQEAMIEATLDYLFSTEDDPEDIDKLIFDVMMTGKDRYPRAKQMLIEMFEVLVNMFVKSLQHAYPHAEESHCRDIAYSIIALAMSHETLTWMGVDARYNTAARASAEALIRTLA